MDKPSRFDLEDAISACWNTSADIELLAEHVGEQESTDDSVLNILQGIKELHELRCQRVFDIFSALIASRKIT